MKKIKISNWTFFVVFLAYLFVSGLLFTLTTAGWSGFYVAIFVFLPFVVLALTMLIVSLVRNFKGVKHVFFGFWGLLPLLVFQLLALLSNRMDCGDNFGSFSFFKYLLNGFNTIDLCGNNIRYYPEYDPRLWVVFVTVYLISIIIFFSF